MDYTQISTLQHKRTKNKIKTNKSPEQPERINMLTKEQFGITSEKMFNFALNMFTPSSETYDNGTQAMRSARYKGNDNVLAVRASSLIRNSKILAVKRALQKDIAKKYDHNLAKAMELLHEALDMSRTEHNTPAFISAVRELDDICGLKQQNDNRQAVSIVIQPPEQPVKQVIEGESK